MGPATRAVNDSMAASSSHNHGSTRQGQITLGNTPGAGAGAKGPVWSFSRALRVFATRGPDLANTVPGVLGQGSARCRPEATARSVNGHRSGV